MKDLMTKPTSEYNRWWYKKFMGIENATMETHIKCNIVTTIVAIVSGFCGAYSMPEFHDWVDDKVDELKEKFHK